MGKNLIIFVITIISISPVFSASQKGIVELSYQLQNVNLSYQELCKQYEIMRISLELENEKLKAQSRLLQLENDVLTKKINLMNVKIKKIVAESKNDSVNNDSLNHERFYYVSL